MSPRRSRVGRLLVVLAPGGASGSVVGHSLRPRSCLNEDVVAFARGGMTSLRDAALRCERDHHWLHQGGTPRLTDGRELDRHGWVS